MKITKLLSPESRPARALLDRAAVISLTYAERVAPPAVFVVGDATLENGLVLERPLEVGDALIDERGAFYVVGAASDRLLRISGEAELLQEAQYALKARGLRLASAADSFLLPANDSFRTMLTSVGLTAEDLTAPFIPDPLPSEPEPSACGCGCCGGHHHHHDDDCCCHEHHHHDDECCHGDHHHDEDCCCHEHHHGPEGHGGSREE